MDGNVAFAQVLEVATAIVASVDVPVTVDMEAGHGSTPAEVGESVDRIIACGAVGINLEDGVPGHTGELFATSDQSARIAAARGAAERSGVPIFINARCDVYFGAQIDADARRDEALSRSKSYQDAGADGLFLPGLLDTETIRSLTAEIELPLNIMIGTGAPSYADLSAAGVRRVSQGGEPFLALVGFLKSITERYLAGDMSPSPAGDLGVGVTLLSALAG
jgi:2-methylisocitrate lyase-like PEP mutase family enzyme